MYHADTDHPSYDIAQLAAESDLETADHEHRPMNEQLPAERAAEHLPFNVLHPAWCAKAAGVRRHRLTEDPFDLRPVRTVQVRGGRSAP